ncbi:MAG: type II toxin-antitoxin system prevent-host-death family antitoxin [Bacteroidales bacterium]|nr:type II toxin-antitoxin system prevent-host-death family antitoxin [Bacteroidales bacterium]
MNNIVTANDLKVKGVSIIEEITSKTGEAIISVRGKNKYVVLSIDEYNQLREYELDAAIKESKDDIEAGRFFDESIEEHIKRITSV